MHNSYLNPKNSKPIKPLQNIFSKTNLHFCASDGFIASLKSVESVLKLVDLQVEFL